MSSFKEDLLKMIQSSVAYLLNGKLIDSAFTEYGLFCDFDMPEPLKPENLNVLSKYIHKQNIACVYELSSFSGVYMDGDSSNKMLQRIYVTAFQEQTEFDDYKNKFLKASEHDHKKLGAQLDLFSVSDEIGAGLVLWHPKGAIIRYLLEQFSQSAHILNDYQWAYTPHIGRAELWKTSGHLDFYKDSMYNPINIDGEEYYLKPMNCPFHINIYNSQKRSYRDLPFRMAEFGTVYRYELSGTLHGLTRVRGFTQDDAHIICAPEQVEKEVISALKFSLYILRSFGLTDFKPYISTKPKTKFIGSDDEWNKATEVLKKAVVAAGLEYQIDEGGGAFYGPKIDLKLFDSLEREWQCSTIQFDFNLPERFKMSYIGSDGKRHTPFMVHRALFGSIERFLALLIEHYKGAFPLWLAPVQFAIVPINPSHNDYCRKLEIECKKQRLRVEADYTDTHMREKIKRFEMQKIPYILVIGDKDIAQQGFSVRSRKKGNLGLMHMESLLAYIEQELEQGKPKYILDD